MPKLRPETQALRRDHILDVAEQCFAANGFHRTTTADICRKAGISAGALYGHFDSKEALIAGLCERDRAQFAERFKVVAEAPDFLAALGALGETVFAEEPAHKRLVAAEMAVESTRNPRVAEIYRSVDTFISQSFETLFARLKAEGRIAPEHDIAEVARAFQVVGDGLYLRRAVHPDFTFEGVRDALFAMIECLLRPVAPVSSASLPERLPTAALASPVPLSVEVTS
jgi:TetR/AcrR family transcriptional regulator, repressor for uid operon